MNWNVYNYDINRKKIEVVNIFEHRTFTEYVKKAAKKCETKDEFAEQLKRELRYYFWSKSQYELIIEVTEDNHIFLNPWVGCRNPEEVRIDVTDDTDFDWRSFAEEHINRQMYYNKAKIDVYDQVIMNWGKFVEFCWDNKKEISKLR